MLPLQSSCDLLFREIVLNTLALFNLSVTIDYPWKFSNAGFQRIDINLHKQNASQWCGTVCVAKGVSGAAHQSQPHPPLQVHYCLAEIHDSSYRG